MGLTKQYRRFVAGGSFGLVGSTRGGAKRLPWKADLVAAAAAELVTLWNLRTGEKVGELGKGESDKEVTALEAAKKTTLAVGYHDGAVRLFDADAGTLPRGL